MGVYDLSLQNDAGLDKTFIYEYNDNGNVTSVKAYSYTSDAEPSGTPLTTTAFGYNATYPDRLTSFGGTTIAYNSIGCPTSYDGMNAAWTRGKLSRLSSGTLASGTTSYVYNYNAYGQRVSKTYSYLQGTSSITPVQTGEVIGYNKQYYYDHSGRLIAEKIAKTLYPSDASAEQIVYLYDESSIIGMEYTSANGSAQLYYFQRNLQGDVTAIFDTSGNMVANYRYDAWGNCTIGAGTTDYAVANANPIRYRGYYYDDDTGLYYCNARYYSPKWRRFISPDDTAYLDPESVNGLNLYCYCNNDPVNYADPSGCAMVSFLIGLGIAALIGAGMGAASYAVGQFVDGVLTGDFEWSWGGFLGAAVGGAVGGALAYTIGGIVVTSKAAAFGIKMAGAFLSGAATNAGTMIGENISGDAAYSAEDIAFQSILSGGISAFSVGLASKLRIQGLNKGRGSFEAVSNQIYTKFRRQLIKRIAIKTFGKMVAVEAYGSVYGFVIENIYSISGAKNYVLSLI